VLPYHVELEISGDVGATWDVPLTSLTGDVGNLTTPGSKHIVWDSSIDWGGALSDLRFRIFATDRSNGGPDITLSGLVFVAPGTSAGSDPVTTYTPFYIGRYETTNQEMAAVMQWAYDEGGLIQASSEAVTNLSGEAMELLDLDSPSSQISFSNGTFTVDDGMENYPCIFVSWYGAAAYCNFRSMREGLIPSYEFTDWTLDFSVNGYRLPQFFEWGFAAQGGDKSSGLDTTFSGSNNPDEVAWFLDNADEPGNSGINAGPDASRGTFPVGMKAPNELDLFDLSGNVWEWCQDSYALTDNAAFARGSSWLTRLDALSLPFWLALDRASTASDLGFRVVRVPDLVALSFDAAGGSEIPPIIQDKGTVVAAPPAPEKVGYAFVGWVPEFPGIMPEASLTLTAQWVQQRISVTLDAAEGVIEADTLSVTYAAPYGTIPAPSREGYRFKGWWTGPDGSGQQITSASVVAINWAHTLFADWEPVRSLTVINGSGSDLYAAGETVQIAANASTAGQAFNGWIASPSTYQNLIGAALSAQTVFTMPDADVVLTATFVEKTYM